MRISVGYCNALGNFVIFTSILRCLASISDNNQVDLVLDDGWKTETRKIIQEIAESLPFVRKVVGYPSEYRAKDYDQNYMSFHSILYSSFFKDLRGDEAFNQKNYVCWAKFLHERDFYLREIEKQFGYRGPIFDQYVPMVKISLELPKPYVVISNGYARTNEGIWVRKAYPHYAELIETILEYDEKLSVVLVGNQDDDEWANEMLVQVPTFSDRIVNVCGKCSVMETATIINEAKFGIYTDSLCAHIADALKRPGVVLWGSTLVSKSGPLNNTLINIRSPLLCSPCQSTSWFHECKDPFECMASIPVSWIMATIRKNFLTK